MLATQMKAVVLAGGMGTRISEESHLRPKPMIEIGGRPILWHVMKLYSHFGINDFIICLGYKGYVIKEYFANYFLHNADVTIDISNNRMDVHQRYAEPWKVTLIDTGDTTMTGGRLRRIRNYLDQDFCLTYGDGVGNIDIEHLIAFHRSHARLATVTAAQPPGRYGALKIAKDRVLSFKEKPVGDGGWVNAGFFVLSPKVVDYIGDDSTVWEQEPIETLARENQLRAHFHRGFWQPMDTLRDKTLLDGLWTSGMPPWKLWE
jgi:glucose-1-phosphate cytidylyltransferase